MRPTTQHENVELTADQIEIVGQFNDYAFENPGKTFEEVVLMNSGRTCFRQRRREGCSEKECREVFDREREA
jgi:hypothetical protein